MERFIVTPSMNDAMERTAALEVKEVGGYFSGFLMPAEDVVNKRSHIILVIPFGHVPDETMQEMMVKVKHILEGGRLLAAGD